ncbi:MAG: hypothetical protein R3E97_04950 [Candidatus Eisenbacteria bacterium]
MGHELRKPRIEQPGRFRGPAWARDLGLRGPSTLRSDRSAALLAVLALLCSLGVAGDALAFRVADAPGIEIISPEEVLAEHTFDAPGGVQMFEYPNGSVTRFVTSVEDPEIHNPGDGTFFPASVSVVEAAVRAVPASLLRGLEVQIYVLPYPRSGMIGSSADGAAIYLTPGVREYSEAEVHFLIAHELGHTFHRKHLPYGDSRWDDFRQLRGLEDEEQFRFDGPHADRPQEILAEDFRVLFGGELAAGNGSVENDELLRPDEVPGLERFLFGLAGDGVDVADGSGAKVLAYPNPVSSGARMNLRLPTGESATVQGIFDASGRLVARPDSRFVGDELTVDIPQRFAPGSYWLRLRTEATVRTVPLRIAP